MVKKEKNRTRRVRLKPVEPVPPAAFSSDRRRRSGLSRMSTLEEWLDYWLNEVIMFTREPTTIYCYANIVNRHLIPALGQVRLCDLSPSLLQSYYAWVGQQKSLSSNTVRKHHILLHTALQMAYRRGILEANPMDRVDPPKQFPAHQSFYNPEQLATLLDQVKGNELELPVKLAGYLGLRRSEITGLRWCDVDLDRGTLSIRQIRTAAGNQIVCKAPKTAGSMRTLEIACIQDLMDLLRRQHQLHRRLIESRGLSWREDVCIVIDREGRPWHPNRLTFAFANFITARGLPKVTLHGLRHTFASVANDARVPMYQISRTLGHSDPTITARIYTHVFDQTHGEVLSAVIQSIPKG